MKSGSVTERGSSSNVAESFNRAARTYLVHAQVQQAMADWLANWVPVRRNGCALEIGGGPGLFTERLLPWKGRLLATDISPEMCAMGQTALPQVEWQIMAAEAPAAGPWDWIFCSSMLQWAAQPEEILAAWRERLATDGRVLAGLFVSETLPELRELMGQPRGLIWRTAEAWRQCLARSGLRILRDDSERRVFRHASALALLRSLHGTGATPERRFSPGRLRGLLREYESRHRSTAGVRSTWTFYRFEAVRAE